jgi:hypothetical protein
VKPYSDIEGLKRLLGYGTLFILGRLNENGTVECFIIENEEIKIEELQNEQELRR